MCLTVSVSCLSSTSLLRPREGYEVLWWVCLSVCLFICSFVCKSKTALPAKVHQFLCMFSCLWPWLGALLTALRCYAFPVLRMTSCFHTMGPMGRIKHGVMFRRVCQVAVPVGRHAVFGWVRQNAAAGRSCTTGCTSGCVVQPTA